MLACTKTPQCFIHADHVGLKTEPWTTWLWSEVNGQTTTLLFCLWVVPPGTCSAGRVPRFIKALLHILALFFWTSAALFLLSTFISPLFYLLLPHSVFLRLCLFFFFAANMLCDTQAKGCGLSTSKNEGSVDRAENCPCWSLK